MNPMLRVLLLLIPVCLPGPFKRAWYRWLLGWRVGKGVHIGLSYLDAKEVDLGDGVRIGHFNVVRSVARFVVGRQTVIANFNMVVGARERAPGWSRALLVGEGVYLTSHHFFDVAGEVVIGDRTIVAGRETHFWSHTILLRSDRLVLTPLKLHVGRDCYIGARATLLFCSLPDGCLVGAGSVVTRSFEPADGRQLIAGNPADVRKTYLPAGVGSASPGEESCPTPRAGMEDGAACG